MPFLLKDRVFFRSCKERWRKKHVSNLFRRRCILNVCYEMNGVDCIGGMDWTARWIYDLIYHICCALWSDHRFAFVGQRWIKQKFASKFCGHGQASHRVYRNFHLSLHSNWRRRWDSKKMKVLRSWILMMIVFGRCLQSLCATNMGVVFQAKLGIALNIDRVLHCAV